MQLIDFNVLVYAHRGELPRHAEYRAWLENLLNGDASFGMASGVLARFVRTVTHPRVFTPPTSIEDALRFTEIIRKSDNCVPVRPGPRQWEIFTNLCRATEAKGNIVTIAYLAALAIESGSEWITTDRDYARFPGLRWRHPLG